MKLTKWRGILKRARKRGKFTLREARLANDWPTCAVGERHHAMGYDFLQQVLPEEYQLGYDFGNAVMANRFNLAQAIIEKLEALPL